MNTYRVIVKHLEGRPTHVIFPWSPKYQSVKVRGFSEKKFQWSGEDWKDGPQLLFGQEAFPPGCSDTVTITEGEYDAMSIFQTTNRPAVSVRGSSSARKDCQAQWKYLNSFDKIKLAFDTDEPGTKARDAVAALFDFNKVYCVHLDPGLKDANAYLQADREVELRRLWWNAKRFMPDGVISTFAEFEEAMSNDSTARPLSSFPWTSLESKLLGLRPGEITLLTAQEGIGKTEILRAIEHHILSTTDENLGIIHLEENKARTVKGLCGLQLGEPAHLPDSTVSQVNLSKALRDLVRREDRLHIYSQFGGDNADSICDLMRFIVVACGCRIVTLDHITMLATGQGEEDERRFLDQLSTKFGRLVNELGFHLILISHVNDDGKTRGSRNISKICANRVDLHRDITSGDETERNTTRLMVSKARFSSLTGPAGELFFDRETFSLRTEARIRPVELPA